MSDYKQVCKLDNLFKIFDHNREHKKSIIVYSFKELVTTAQKLFNFPVKSNIKVVLEQDGTEIEDEEYFATLEKYTSLMILYGDQKWVLDLTKNSTFLIVDDTDFISNKYVEKIQATTNNSLHIKSILSLLCKDSSYIYFLTDNDFEMLSNIDPIKISDIISDIMFINQLKEVSNRFLADKCQVRELTNLLQIFLNNTC